MSRGAVLPALTMRCDVERDHGGDDPLGLGQDWQPHLTGQRCSWWVNTGREQIDSDRTVTLAEEHLRLPVGTDIRQGDRVTRVRTREGRVMFDSFREVEHVAQRRGHIDCTLRASD